MSETEIPREIRKYTLGGIQGGSLSFQVPEGGDVRCVSWDGAQVALWIEVVVGAPLAWRTFATHDTDHAIREAARYIGTVFCPTTFSARRGFRGFWPFSGPRVRHVFEIDGGRDV